MGCTADFLGGANIDRRMVADAYFVSIWDGGSVIQTCCKVDLSTREVFNIQIVDVSDFGLMYCVDQYVLLNGQRFAVRDVGDRYFLAEEDDEA